MESSWRPSPGPPATVRNVLYGNIARLKSVLASTPDAGVTLSRQPGGYQLQASPAHRSSPLLGQPPLTHDRHQLQERRQPRVKQGGRGQVSLLFGRAGIMTLPS